MVRHTGTYDCRLDLKERLHLGLMIDVNGQLSSFIIFRQYLALLLSSQRNYLHCIAQSETVVLAVHSHVCFQQQSLISVSIIFIVKYQEVRSDINVKTFTKTKPVRPSFINLDSPLILGRQINQISQMFFNVDSKLIQGRGSTFNAQHIIN